MPAKKNLLTIDMDNNPDAIASQVATAMTRKGVADAKRNLLTVLNHPKGGSAETVKAATRLFTSPTNDTWSGRTNDMIRAYNDGVRRVAGKVLDDALLYGEEVTERTLRNF